MGVGRVQDFPVGYGSELARATKDLGPCIDPETIMLALQEFLACPIQLRAQLLQAKSGISKRNRITWQQRQMHQEIWAAYEEILRPASRANEVMIGGRICLAVCHVNKQPHPETSRHALRK